MDLNIDTAKSYATEANLLKALGPMLREKTKYVIVRNRAGRWTAIFPLGLNREFLGGNVTFFANKGFMTVS